MASISNEDLTRFPIWYFTQSRIHATNRVVCLDRVIPSSRAPRSVAQLASENYSNTSVPKFAKSWKLGPTRDQSQLVVLPPS